jgi:Lon protease-like protein
MISECIRESRPFGVVLIRSGQEIGEPAETYEVGTTAHITQVKYLDDGEINIATLGHKRFRVASVHHKKPYLTGLVEDFPLQNTQDPLTLAVARRLGPLVKKYLNIFATLGDVDFKLEKLPDDPVTLAFLTAIILNVPAKDKQTLLTVPDLLTMLRVERKMLSREAEILKFLIDNGPRWRDDPRLFSPN